LEHYRLSLAVKGGFYMKIKVLLDKGGFYMKIKVLLDKGGF
jgi:hypothetical protein